MQFTGHPHDTLITQGDLDPGVGPGDGGTNSHIERALRLLSVLTLLVATGLGLAAIAFPHELSYVEGYLLEQGVRLATGDALYRPLGEPAWLVDNFPPLYPLIAAGTVHLFGPSFGAGRAVTSLSILGLSILLYHWTRQRGATQAIAWGVLALWVASPWVLRRGVMLRMDFFAILLVALALYLFLRRHQHHPLATLIASAGLFIAAWATRQTLLAAPAALFLALLIHKRPRPAILLAAIATTGVALIVIGLTLLTQGGFLDHIIGYNLGEWSLDSFLRRTGMTLLLQLPLLLLGALGVVAATRERSLPGTTLALWFLFAALATVTTGKQGSDYNHHLELLFVAALLAPAGLRFGIDHLRARTSTALKGLTRPDPVATALAALLIIQLIVTATTLPIHSSINSLSTGEPQDELQRILDETEGPVLSERAGPLVLAGKEVLWEPRTMRELHRAESWDDTDFTELINTQHWSLVITENFTHWNTCNEGCRWTPDAWHALQESYQRSEDLGRWVVWRPR